MEREARWLLPEGVDELLPPHAAEAEALRRELIDLHAAWGYELVMPPFIEYLDSLLTGTGHGLDLQTFKLTDQLSGRLLGVRADMTPQAARIDAHQLRRAEVTRLCYVGSTLQARPEGPAGSRNPVQLGAEVYGHPSFESDVEIISLLLETLRTAGITSLHLDLGHVGVFRELVREARLEPETEQELFEALQRKAGDDMLRCLHEAGVGEERRARLVTLARLHGGTEVLAEAERELSGAGRPVADALAELRSVADALAQREPELPLHFDLGELRGYRYQTGVVFAAYVPGHGRALARGGRYDGIGRAFGRHRPATGYSADLKTLLALGGVERRAPAAEPGGVLAPWGNDPALIEKVRALRAGGERVVWSLPGDACRHACDRRLVERQGEWDIEDI